MIEIVMEVDDEFWNIINQLKEFKGQKEIIHCKDCKYWDEEQTQCNYRLLTEDVHMKVMADDFCSRGERKKPTEF